MRASLWTYQRSQGRITTLFPSRTTFNVHWTRHRPLLTPGASTRSFASSPPPPPVHYVPIDQRHEKPLFNLDPWYHDRVVRKNRNEPTRELNFTPQHWQDHKSPFRKLRHLSNILRSSPLQRLAFPDLTIIASTAAALTYWKLTHDNATIFFSDSAYFGTGSTAIGA